MRRATSLLLTGSYFTLALTFAILLWRNGGGWGAGVAALAGGLALCFTFHALISGVLSKTELQREVEVLRDAHRILMVQIQQVDDRMTQVLDRVVEDAQRRSDDVSGEIHRLEDMVHRMGQTLEDRFTPTSHRHRPEAAPLRRQSAVLLDTVREALAENRVDLYLQPIVSLPQRRTAFYEGFSRLRDESGRIIMPAEFMAIAEPEGLMSAVDNLLLFRCVQIVRRLAKTDKKIGIFCNISMTSLGDERFFPQFLDLLSDNKDLAGALIFELGQAAYEGRGATEARNMGKLADLGFRFSLDKITDLDLDFQDLARSDIKFLKVSAQVMHDLMAETQDGPVMRFLPDLAAQDYSALAGRYGIEMIVEKVESERQVVDSLELDITYGQGHLFGEPRAIRDTILAKTDPPTTFLRDRIREQRTMARA